MLSRPCHRRCRSASRRSASAGRSVARQLAGQAEADDLMHSQRAGAQPALVAAAEYQRLQRVRAAARPTYSAPMPLGP